MTDECKKALAKLKEYLTKPPLLSPLVMEEKLNLYLAVSNTVKKKGTSKSQFLLPTRHSKEQRQVTQGWKR